MNMQAKYSVLMQPSKYNCCASTFMGHEHINRLMHANMSSAHAHPSTHACFLAITWTNHQRRMRDTSKLFNMQLKIAWGERQGKDRNNIFRALGMPWEHPLFFHSKYSSSGSVRNRADLQICSRSCLCMVLTGCPCMMSPRLYMHAHR